MLLLSLLDTLPERGSQTQEDFSLIADEFLYWLKQTDKTLEDSIPDLETALDIASILQSGLSSAPLYATSTSSVSIGTGEKTFTIEPGKGFRPGQLVSARVSGTPFQMLGIVSSYSSTTLTCSMITTFGTGTYSNWVITLAIFDKADEYIGTAGYSINAGEICYIAMDGKFRPLISSPETVFSSSISSVRMVEPAGTNRAVVLYDISNSTYAVIVLLNSDKSLTVGSGVQISTGPADYASVCYDSTHDRLVFFYTVSENTYARVGSITGTTITLGEEQSFYTGTVYTDCCFYPTSSKVVGVCNNIYENYLISKVGTVSDMTITFGSASLTTIGPTTYATSVSYAPIIDKILIARCNTAGDHYLGVGTVSGNTLLAPSTLSFLGQSAAVRRRPFYIPDAGRFIVIAKDKLFVGYIGGTTISNVQTLYIPSSTYISWSCCPINPNTYTGVYVSNIHSVALRLLVLSEGIVVEELWDLSAPENLERAASADAAVLPDSNVILYAYKNNTYGVVRAVSDLGGVISYAVSANDVMKDTTGSFFMRRTRNWMADRGRILGLGCLPVGFVADDGSVIVHNEE